MQKSLKMDYSDCYQEVLNSKIDEAVRKIPDLPKGVGEVAQVKASPLLFPESGLFMACVEVQYHIPFVITNDDFVKVKAAKNDPI
jgi:hypothetical protein